MGSYVASIWRCRYFWSSLVKMDLRTRYRGSLLGMGWSLLNPIAMTIILTAVFSKLPGMDDVEVYAPFLLAGLATWNYILTATLQGCHCFFHGEAYMRQYPAPLAIYPLRTALGGTVHFFIAMLLVLGLAWYFKGFSNLVTLWSLVPTLCLLFVFAWSLAVLAGCLNVHFQDTKHLAEVGFQMLFYASPIIYKPKLLLDNHLDWLVNYNPLVPLLQLIREPILEAQVPSVQTFGVATLTVVLTALAAGITLARLQRRLLFYM